MTSSKKIKAGQMFKFARLGKLQGNQFGFTEREARSIFGNCYEYTEEQAAIIREYENRKSKRKQAIAEKKPTEQPKQIEKPKTFEDTLIEKQDELSRLGLKLVGFRRNDGEVTYLG